MTGKMLKEKDADKLNKRWACLIDNSRYLNTEYMYKEKEYGIAWRANYKDVL